MSWQDEYNEKLTTAEVAIVADGFKSPAQETREAVADTIKVVFDVVASV